MIKYKPYLVYVESNVISEMSFVEMMEFKFKYGLRLPQYDEMDYGQDRRPGFIAYVFESVDSKLKLEFILRYGDSF